ncbi:MAG: hypothetical protein NXI27_27810 [Alphaproteobacteria bacterium]|nr:hypothetical protein [Alphaproteobacteria bacterium]
MHRIFRDKILLWLGILGLVMNLFSSLQPLIQLSIWARYLILKWDDLIEYFWVSLFAFLNLDFPPYMSMAMTTAVFIVLMGMGSSRSILNFLPWSAHRKDPDATVEVHSSSRQTWTLIVSLSIIQVLALVAAASKQGLDLVADEAKGTGKEIRVIGIAYFILFVLAVWNNRDQLRELSKEGPPLRSLAVFIIAPFVVGTATFYLGWIDNDSLSWHISFWLALVWLARAPALALVLADTRLLLNKIIGSLCLLLVLVGLNFISVYGPALLDLIEQPPT